MTVDARCANRFDFINDAAYDVEIVDYHKG